MASKKAAAVSLAVVGAAGLAWVGGSVVVGQRAETALQELKGTAPGTGGGLRITRLTHERSLFGAKGQAELTFVAGCAAEGQVAQPRAVRIDYTMSNLILPGSAARFEWKAAPLGSVAREFQAVFGSAAELSGTGKVGLDGALRADMALPELAMQRAGESLQVAPSRGFLSVRGEALAFGWKLDRVTTRGRGQALEARDIAVDLDLRNRRLGTGTASVSVEHVSFGQGTLEGVSLRSEAREQGDRLDMTVTPAVRRVKAVGVELSDLSLELAMKGLHTKSLEVLVQVFQDSCGMQSLTAEEGRKARDAATALLARGFSLGIPRIAGKGQGGAIDGKVMVELAEAKDGRPSLAAQLRSSGQVEVTGEIVPAAQREMAVRLGFAMAKGSGLVAGYSYADGVLKVNERAQDASGLLAGLKVADARIQTAMAGWSEARPVLARAPEAPASAETAEAAAEPVAREALSAAPAAPATTAATATATPAAVPAQATPAVPIASADCDAIGACVRETLAAARRVDVDLVRKLAGTIDGLPKPALGNRAVARQLNQTAIEALKRDDATAAVAKLREALKENPRDVEVAGNLGFALVKADRAAEAVEVLQAALVLDPRRTSTWTPLAEAYALAGRAEEAKAAMWVSFQWSSNRDKSLAFYRDRMTRETRAPLVALYTHMATLAQQQIAAAQ